MWNLRVKRREKKLDDAREYGYSIGYELGQQAGRQWLDLATYNYSEGYAHGYRDALRHVEERMGVTPSW